MGMIGQYILNGLMQGTIYGLVAMGFTIFFGAMNVIQFSHGDVFTFGAFGALVAATALAGHGVVVQVAGALAVALVITAVLGAGIARVLIFPMRDAPPLNLLLVTMMVGTVIRECIRLFFPDGTNSQPFPALLPKGGVEFAGAYLRYDGAILIVAGIAVIALVNFVIVNTRFGLALRAVAEDQETARVMGVNAARIIPLTFALGSATGGFAGLMSGLYYSEIDYGMGLLVAVIGFSAAIVGGLGNVWGAVIGGYLFAGLQTAVVAVMPTMSDYKNVVAFVVVIALITWCPTGLLAERSSARV